ncbi:TPA: hypothetical protein QCU42_002409 [Bacillus cereus]|nr:hypothetical protein BCM0074_1922 [Bacillus cereus]HDR6305000.1 hypothetical protein [Bacillus cereus]
MEMIRRDEYAVYKGTEYSISKIGNRFILTSTNQKDLQNGFTPYERNPNLFIKEVEKSQLETAYDITPFAKHKEIMFRIIGENKDKGTVSIYTIDPKVGKELGMSSPGRGEFVKDVRLEDVELIEKVEPIWGFTLNKEN